MNRTSPELQNQPAELTNYNLFSRHSALVDVLAREHSSPPISASGCGCSPPRRSPPISASGCGCCSRATTTRGAPGPGREYRLTGHKWFFSGPMCDAFLVQVQAPGGLSCSLVPRFLPDRVLQRKTAG